MKMMTKGWLDPQPTVVEGYALDKGSYQVKTWLGYPIYAHEGHFFSPKLARDLGQETPELYADIFSLVQELGDTPNWAGFLYNAKGLQEFLKTFYAIEFETQKRAICRQDGGVLYSRGRNLIIINNKDVKDEYLSEECIKTQSLGMKRLNKLQQAWLENDVKEVYIEGGFDWAESVRHYADGDYEPCVSDWAMCIWRNPKHFPDKKVVIEKA